jgi:uncharacterized protein with HEPN domain
MNRRDEIILHKIIRYADEIEATIKRFDLDYEKFSSDFVVRNSISMDILQIGELANALSQDFKKSYTQMPWRDIISMRNRAAHAYDDFDKELVWNTAVADIFELKKYCEKLLTE